MENQNIILTFNERLSDAIAWIRPVMFGAVVGFSLMSFQNCQRVSVSDLPRSFSTKAAAGPDVDPPVADSTPQVPEGRMPDGDVIVPVDGEVRSVYVCPPGTSTPSSEPPAASSAPKVNSKTNVSYGYGLAVSSGSNYASASASAVSTGDGSNFISINQTGDTNTAYVYQNGTDNHSSITQNGTNNSACVVQIGDKNESNIDQTGTNNTASVEQIGGQNSQITQNGSPGIGVSHDSAQACGCQLVHCDSANASLDPTCRQAVSQKVIMQ